MKRVLLPLLLVALSSLIAIVSKEPQGNNAPLGNTVIEHQLVAPSLEGPDSLSFIQAANIHVNLLGQHEDLPKEAKPSKDRDGTHVPWRIQHLGHSAVGSAAHALHDVLKSSFSTLALRIGAHRLASKNVVSTSIIVILILSALLIAWVFFCAYQGDRRRRGAATSNDLREKFPGTSESAGMRQELLPPRPNMQGSGGFRSPPASDDQLRHDSRIMSPQPDGSAFNPLSPYASPMGSMAQMPAASQAPQFIQQLSPPVSTDVLSSSVDRRLPPALCPNVVLPNCEVRVGVPMHELGKFGAEGTGELTIVGLSGNPLLRASLRKSEAGRTLEVSMPEPRSAPRAIVGPSFHDVVGPDMQKSRAVQIYGMKGVFYGMLEMRSSGACYVVKDGQTVLIIDGDSEVLQLSIKSGQGAHLAGVACSSEPFGGAEHLEVRIQPGVDTVLVLACVLAVVLLSPYPPSD